jgi:hypothetical protein
LREKKINKAYPYLRRKAATPAPRPRYTKFRTTWTDKRRNNEEKEMYTYPTKL